MTRSRLNGRIGVIAWMKSLREAPSPAMATRAQLASEIVGKAVAERAIAAGVKDVVFDRGGYMYSRTSSKALADAAREAGLKF